MEESERQERHFLIMVGLMLLFYLVAQLIDVSNANRWTQDKLDPSMARTVFHDFFIAALLVFQQVPKMLGRIADAALGRGKQPDPEPKGPLGPRLVERLKEAE